METIKELKELAKRSEPVSGVRPIRVGHYLALQEAIKALEIVNRLPNENEIEKIIFENKTDIYYGKAAKAISKRIRRKG